MKRKIFAGIASAGALLTGLGAIGGVTLERYRALIDANLGTRNAILVTDDDGSLYSKYVPDSKYLKMDDSGNIIGGNSQALVDAHKDLGRRVCEESTTLLKNNNKALPIQNTSTVTLLGMRSFTLQGQIGEASGYNSEQDIKFADALKSAGVNLNETMLSVYSKMAEKGFSVANGTSSSSKNEPTIADLDSAGIDYKSSFKSSDTAIIVVGRGGGEGLSWGDLSNDPTESTDTPLALTSTEKELIKLAEDNFDKVIVMLNTGAVMEIDSLKQDEKIDAIVWAGLPGNYGSVGIANVLAGKVAPSGGLANIYATSSMSSPSMANFGTQTFANADEITMAPFVIMPASSSYYEIEAEGIYTGYKYYETRYYDSIVNPNSKASSSKGVYAQGETTWKYSKEVSYGFGYGLSYTNFETSIGEPEVYHQGHDFTLTFPVSVKNTGEYDAKFPIQLYVNSPYTDYDKKNGVEKVASSLVTFEKTPTIKKGDTYTTNITVDMQNVASWDNNALNGNGSYILDKGDYYFAVGNGAHDALNNMLALEGKSVSDGMDYAGNSKSAYRYSYAPSIEGDVDALTFSITKNGTSVKNELDHADWNKYSDVTEKVTYLSRNDWDSTWPKTYSGLSASASMKANLYGDTYKVKTDDDTSDIIWEQDNGLTLADMIGASFDDPRWEQLLNQLTIEDAINLSCSGGRNFNTLKSIGFNAEVTLSTDGPGGIKMNLGKSVTPDAPWTIKEGDINYDYRLNTYTNGVTLASTFNNELFYEEGELTGIDGLFVGVPIFWGVGINTHRNPYGNRNGEYYSEDPVLTGIVGMEFAVGGQSKGMAMSGKHLAFYDQGGQHGLAVFMTEQRARENELRAFQIPVEATKYVKLLGRQDVGMHGIMTSFVKLGTIEMTTNKAVLTDILRQEWGFNGYVTSDGLDDLGLCNTAWTSGLTGFIIYMPGYSGNDLYKNATPENYKNDREMLLCLRENVKRDMWVFANSNYVNATNKTSHSVWQMTPYRAAYIFGTGASALITLAAAATYLVLVLKKKGE